MGSCPDFRNQFTQMVCVKDITKNWLEEMTVEDIIQDYIRSIGADGLANVEYEPCGCTLEDLFSCGS